MRQQNKKRILIDGRFVGVGESISRYVLEMLQGILQLDKENEYTLLIRPEGEKALEQYPNIVNANNLKIDILEIPHYSFAEQTQFLRYLNREKYDLVHFTQFNHPIFYHGKYVVTIHDLTLIGHLHYHNFIKQLAFNLVMKSAARDSAKIIAISKTTMDDIIDFFGTSKEKFSIIYHGLDHENYNLKVRGQIDKIKEFKDKNNITGDYILYTGAWKKHKNILRFLKAFKQFVLKNDSPLQLVMVGKVDQKEPEVTAEINRINSSLAVILSDRRKSKDLSNINTIVTTGFIEEEELPFAYAGAFFYVIPSLSEGFGWPPLEAMACGTPVIASKLSCIPEILGDAALYFDPYSEDAMVKSMEKISKDSTLCQELIRKGIEQVKKYNWETTAKETLEVYRLLLNDKGGGASNDRRSPGSARGLLPQDR